MRVPTPFGRLANAIHQEGLYSALVMLTHREERQIKGLSSVELYVVTRGTWKVCERREKVEYVFAVFDGLVRAYAVHSWYPARTLNYQTRDISACDMSGRWEFDDSIAPSPIRDRYLHTSVRHYFERGNQSPTAALRTSTDPDFGAGRLWQGVASFADARRSGDTPNI